MENEKMTKEEERLIFIEKVELGIKEIEEGKGIAHEEVKKIVIEWRR